jgi:hypothetical protein
MRFMSLYKPGRESDRPPTPEEMQKVGALIEEMVKSGALLATDGLVSSSHGAKVRISGGKFTVVDGPFPEAKEIVGGYAIINAASKAEAIALAKRFLSVMGEGECEVREMLDAPVLEERAAG